MGSSPRSNSFTSIACPRWSDGGVQREVREREQAITSAACGPNTFSHCDEETGAAYLRAVTEMAPKSPFFMCEQKPYPVWFSAIRDSVNIPEVALFMNSRGLVVSYYYMRNFCNLIALEQWYFSLI